MTKDKSGDEEKGEKPKDKAGEDERKEKGKDKPVKKTEIAMGDVFKVDNTLMAAGPYYKVKGARAKKYGPMETCGDGGEGRGEKREGTFCLEGDERVRCTVKRYREGVLSNMTLSFDPSTMMCTGCTNRGPHSVIGAEDGKPVVFVATDQNFPPVLYSKDKENCMAILRIEDGTIKDVSFAVSDLLKGIELPAGSVVLMGSMTSVAKLGAQSYAHKLSRSVRILGERLGTRIGIHPLIPVPICGINNTRVVRNLLELDVWMEKIGETEAGIFRSTREKLVETIRRHGEGAKRSNEEFILVMPAGLNSRDTISLSDRQDGRACPCGCTPSVWRLRASW
jgi:hypothetical protein